MPNKNLGIYAIVPSAGSGSRLNSSSFKRLGESKVLLDLNGKTLIEINIQSLIKAAVFQAIVLVIRNGDEEIFQKIVEKYKNEISIHLVLGGETRQESVFNGLEFLKDKNPLTIAIHDGARAFCSPEKIQAVVECASINHAAILALPAKNSLKMVNNSIITKSILRENIWEAQTPQVFNFELIYKAHLQAKLEKLSVTDDSELVEGAGHHVHILTGEENNIKITTEFDLQIIRQS